MSACVRVRLGPRRVLRLIWGVLAAEVHITCRGSLVEMLNAGGLRKSATQAASARRLVPSKACVALSKGVCLAAANRKGTRGAHTLPVTFCARYAQAGLSTIQGAEEVGMAAADLLAAARQAGDLHVSR